MARTRILIAEQNPTDARKLQEILRDLGYTVTSTASTSRQAVDKARKDKPDLVLINVVLEGKLNGAAAARQIHTQFDIPIVYVTVHSSRKALKAAQRAEPFGYILKPVHAKELQAAIEIALSRHTKEKELKEKESILNQLIIPATDGICILDSQLNIRKVKVTSLEGLEFKEKDIIGTNIIDLIPRGMKRTWRQRFNEVIRTGKPFSLNNYAVAPKFGDRIINLKAFKAGDGLGLIVTDITEKRKVEEALRESETRFYELAKHMSESLIVQDAAGAITYVNEKFLEKSGYAREDVIGHSTTDFLSEAHFKDYEKQVSRRKEGISSTYEIEVKRKDGRKALLLVSAAPILDKENRYKGSIAILTDITEKHRYEKELHRSEEELRRLSQHLHLVREKESQRIAREIHDELGQALTALKMDLSWLTDRFPEFPGEQDKILKKTKSMSTLVDQTIRRVQKIASELRPGIIDDLGLMPALEWQVQDFQYRTKIKCSTRLDSLEIKISPECKIALFRVSQEALTNIARHAQASRVKVIFRERKGNIELKVEDNGKGIAEREIDSPDSLGLIGMRERLNPFGGEIKIKGVPQKGTSLFIKVPIDKSWID